MIDLNPNRANYYKQLNNELDPKNACQCTAAVQCLDILGEVEKIKGPYAQPEDNLRAYCESEPIMTFCVLSHGQNWNKSVDHPSEWADVLVKAVNDIVGYKCAEFIAIMSVGKVREYLQDNKPVMCSMRYEKIPGHYVSVVGTSASGMLIVDDPYKNDLTGDTDGYHNLYSLADWTAHSKGYGIVFNRRT